MEGRREVRSLLKANGAVLTRHHDGKMIWDIAGKKFVTGDLSKGAGSSGKTWDHSYHDLRKLLNLPAKKKPAHRDRRATKRTSQPASKPFLVTINPSEAAEKRRTLRTELLAKIIRPLIAEKKRVYEETMAPRLNTIATNYSPGPRAFPPSQSELAAQIYAEVHRVLGGASDVQQVADELVLEAQIEIETAEATMQTTRPPYVAPTLSHPTPAERESALDKMSGRRPWEDFEVTFGDKVFLLAGADAFNRYKLLRLNPTPSPQETTMKAFFAAAQEEMKQIEARIRENDRIIQAAAVASQENGDLKEALKLYQMQIDEAKKIAPKLTSNKGFTLEQVKSASPTKQRGPYNKHRQLGETSTKVLDYINSKAVAMRTSEIADSLGIGVDQCSPICQSLASGGRIDRIGTGKGTRWVSKSSVENVGVEPQRIPDGIAVASHV